MSENAKVHVKNVSKGAPVWFIGWLFTIGFSDLTFWQGAQGIIIWPYYLGKTVFALISG